MFDTFTMFGWLFYGFYIAFMMLILVIRFLENLGKIGNVKGGFNG